MAEKEGLHQRLKQAIIWLKNNKDILQLDIAKKMGMSAVGLSRGLARCKEKNDEDFVIKFHQATGEIFSLEWLLHGTGEKFAADIKKAEPTVPPMFTSVDTSSAINASIAAYVKLVDKLEDQLAAKDDEMAERLAYKDTIIAEKQSRIEDLEQTVSDKNAVIAEKQARISTLEQSLADKDAIIRARDARIADLERRIAQANADDLSRYPFAFGAAEGRQKPQDNI